MKVLSSSDKRCTPRGNELNPFVWVRNLKIPPDSEHRETSNHYTAILKIMDYIKVAQTDEFETDHIKSYSILAKKIAIIRRNNGTFYAIEIGCKHQGADLTVGDISGTIATCYRHGWKYDLENGKCLNHASPDLKKHNLHIENGYIYISIHPIEEDEWIEY